MCFSLSPPLGSDVMPSLYSLLCACHLLAWLPLVTTSTQRNRNRNLNRWQCFDHSSPGGYLGALGHMIEKKSFHQCMEMLERPVLEEEPQEFQTVENRKVSIIRTFQIASAAPIDIEDQIGQHSTCRCFNTWRCWVFSSYTADYELRYLFLTVYLVISDFFLLQALDVIPIHSRKRHIFKQGQELSRHSGTLNIQMPSCRWRSGNCMRSHMNHFNTKHTLKEALKSAFINAF